MSGEFYVYRLVDPRDGSTFYIGKGKNGRAWDHTNGRSHKISACRGLSPSGDSGMHVRETGAGECKPAEIARSATVAN